MKKLFLLIPLWLGHVAAATTFPTFPAFDPFTNSTASGGTSYAASATLAGQTNAMGQFWYGIDTTGPAGNSITNTGLPLSYLGLPGFSGNSVLLTNAAGPGARMFVATNASGFFVTGPLSIFYSLVLSVSNINSLSTFGDYCIGISDQGTIANQTSQPGTVAARLYFRKNGSNYQLGISKQGLSTNYYSTLFTTNQTVFVVVDYEIITTVATSGTRDNVRLWVNPDPSTFGAQNQPAESANVLASDADLTPTISAVQLHNRATDTPNNLYVTDFRMGTNWAWVTGGPAIANQPIASTNVASGVMTLNVTPMNNGSANGYQWLFNGANLADGPSISGSGATVSGSATASLTVSSLTLADAGSYSVIVTNAYGSVTSSNSIVSTFSTPVITAQPNPTNLLLFAGETNLISLTAVGFAPLNYYWYSNATLVASVTTNIFPLNNAAIGASSIYCVVSNSLGGATSSVVSLTVAPAPTAPYPLAIYNDHPIGFWPLSEVPDNHAGDDGTLAYDYTGGNNGYYTNAVLGQPGYGVGLATQYGYAPATDTNPAASFGQFAFPDSYVAQIPNINFGTAGTASSFSVETWVNGNNASEFLGAGIVNKGYSGNEQFTLDYTTGWRFYVRNAAATSFVALSTNTLDANWHHLVGVLDAVHSNVTIYVDGLARATTAFTPSTGILSTPQPVAFGSRMSTANSDFNVNFVGYIQNVAIYNYALSANQVANHYDAAGVGPTVTVPSSATINEGSTLSIPATAAGSPVLAYQWYDVTLGTPGTPLAGQTNAVLTIPNISAAAFNGHSLDVVVTNIYSHATSGPVLLQINSGAPSSISILPAAMSVYTGVPVPFTVTATGTTPFTYQWSVNGTPVLGATNAVYTNIANSAGSFTIGCLVSNSIGAGTLATASLTAVAAPTDYYGSTILNDGPTAFWRLDEPANATTAHDYAGGHNATYTSALNGLPGFSPIIIPAETSTVFGTNGITPSIAEEINNTNNGIPLIDFSMQGANANFSMEAWVNELPQGGGIFEKGYPNNTQFAFDGGGSGGSFRFVVHSATDVIFTANSGSVLPDGNWHHLVGVCDETHSQMLIYVDGAVKGTSSLPAGSGLLSVLPLYPVVIAAQEAQGGGSFPGITNAAMSQVALYSYALSSNQVSAHYLAATFVAPTISVAQSGTNAVITYTGTLVSSTNAAGPITNVVAGAISPYTIPPTNTPTFYRSRAAL